MQKIDWCSVQLQSKEWCDDWHSHLWQADQLQTENSKTNFEFECLSIRIQNQNMPSLYDFNLSWPKFGRYGNTRYILQLEISFMDWDFLPWAVQKRLNWSFCHLGCGLSWPKEARVESYSPGSTSVHKLNCFRYHYHYCFSSLKVGEHIGTIWWIRLISPSAAAM